jgi:predicted ATP-dependent protease
MQKLPALTHQQLTHHFAVDTFDFNSSQDAHGYIVGQERARKALEMGMGIAAKGYHILVIGSAGSGRRHAIAHVAQQYRSLEHHHLQDIVFANHYAQPENPLVLYFPLGRARLFKVAMADMLGEVRAVIRQQFVSERFKQKRDGLLQALEERERIALSDFEKRLEHDGFKVMQSENSEKGDGPDLLPVYQGKAVSFEELEHALNQGDLSEAEWQGWRERYYRYMDELRQIFSSMRQQSRELEQDLVKLGKTFVQPELEKIFQRLKTDFAYPEVMAYLDATMQHMLDHLPELNSDVDEENDDDNDKVDFEHCYNINILVDRHQMSERPLIFENNPSWVNLFGLIDGKPDEADFMSIKAGSLLQAHGGFLIMRLEDLLQEEELWHHFKRAMLINEVVVQSPPSPLAAPATLKPQPIKIDVKIILTSSELLYEHMYMQDRGFQKLFKVLAEFDDSMPLNDQTSYDFLAYAQHVIKTEQLYTLTEDGMQALLLYGVRLAQHRKRLTCRLAFVADLLREAHYWTKQHGNQSIDATAINQTQAMRSYFHNLPQEVIWREFADKQIFLETKGQSIGKINALVVVDRGFYSFGCPSLITSQVASGKDGVVNIEREAGLSGEIHDKGVLILEGFLRGCFGRETPLAMSASLCFEQSYDGVEGDSATLAETCVLLSALGQFGLRQDIAVTGSMNQLGMVQPVGGVNEKIEGFFQLCLQNGLTGSQGVIFPASNIDNLFLSKEVQQAVADGTFSLWPVQELGQALSLLAGEEVGVKNKKGKYPKHSLFGRVEAQLKSMND